MLHKSRDLMVRKRTMLIDASRGHLTEYGIVTGGGTGGVTAMLKAVHERLEELPVHARSAQHGLAAQLRALASEIDRLERQILAWHRADETSRRLATIPGIGPITGTVRNSVCGPAVEHLAAMALMNRSPKMMANWGFAMDHKRCGIVRSFSDRFKIRWSNLVAASSLGKWPLALTVRLSFEFSTSIALVVSRILRTARGGRRTG